MTTKTKLLPENENTLAFVGKLRDVFNIHDLRDFAATIQAQTAKRCAEIADQLGEFDSAIEIRAEFGEEQ